MRCRKLFEAYAIYLQNKHRSINCQECLFSTLYNDNPAIVTFYAHTHCCHANVRTFPLCFSSPKNKNDRQRWRFFCAFAVSLPCIIVELPLFIGTSLWIPCTDAPTLYTPPTYGGRFHAVFPHFPHAHFFYATHFMHLKHPVQTKLPHKLTHFYKKEQGVGFIRCPVTLVKYGGVERI